MPHSNSFEAAAAANSRIVPVLGAATNRSGIMGHVVSATLHAEIVKDTNVVGKPGSGDGWLDIVSLPVGDSVVELVEECPCCPAFG